ncbi:hypothetical protein [Methylobacterium oryzihabitans]|uniref:Peptidase S53 domain-containing protein n=1 Tax=Methylobacterium oryzihabitans TaxID=2499852 RepID=A0A3S2XHK2_9HYPH|nr:hypothetical protein [Methylobacterium oryzihabitans]RVU14981.1 hypothetical protein EOE48_21405 [Methylobacterium oryzihabitans]
MAQVVLPNSTYLDYTSNGTTTATTVADAYDFVSGPVPATQTINVALMLPRANDPTALLESDWATRQKTLQALNQAGTLWSTYGADPTAFADAVAALRAMNIPVLGLSGTDGYVSSAESRTIWLQVTPAKFGELFGTPALTGTADVPGGSGQTEQIYYWNGALSVPEEIGATGIWFDLGPIWGQYPAFSDMSGGAQITPRVGHQSIGNALSPLSNSGDYRESNNFAADIADWFYNFPLGDRTVPTATIGLVEPGIGNALSAGDPNSFQELLDEFRQTAGLSTPGSYYVSNQGGQSYTRGNSLERSLDVGVVASASPQSTIGLYAGSGFDDHAQSNSFTAFQAAFWDLVNNPSVVSSSFSLFQQSKRGSPFANAVDELFVDAALRNISVAFAGNDWGSSWNFANGLANVATNSSSPYALIVGGTSLTTLGAAPGDPTVFQDPTRAASLYDRAIAGDAATLWRLIGGGLSILPSSVSAQHAGQVALLESVWNILQVSEDQGRYSILPALGSDIAAGDGGVDTNRPVPTYQTDFGLTPTSVNPGGGTGRGTPDVSANSGGNMFFITPRGDMSGLSWDEGTSAAAPLWASLLAQFNTIFADQGLPNLGFSNDLLYQAAAVAPAAFNDITYGNNTSSYLYDGPVTAGDDTITLTGYGYEAGPGYDLTTGLGTPNGLLLARALTAIAHAQMSSTAPAVLDPTFTASSAAQHLLVQPTVRSDRNFALSVAGAPTSYRAAATGSFAWDSAFAQRAMQADFDPALVRLFDGASQSTPHDLGVADGASLGVAFGGGSAATPQAAMTNPFGFVDYKDPAGDGGVRLARAVAVARTAGNADGQRAVVRLRQNTEEAVTASFYRVDDLDGTIDGLAPGQAGYDAAVTGRLYATGSGTTAISGPGDGYYKQLQLTGIDGGDLVAMRLTSGGHDFYGFSAANETVGGSGVTHLWNYGLDTWGWESTFGGGDRDYNDLVVQLDFTSASGSGWLVQDTATGGDGDDVMYGNDEANSMVGGLGDDTIPGAGGNDTLYGGLGDDLVLGQDGDDFVGTGAGNDFGSGGWGNDTVEGGAGNDLLFGDDDDDRVDGGWGDDLVYGGTGDDDLTGDAGTDQLYGQDGDDRQFGGDGGDNVSGGAGDDLLDGGAGQDLLFGNAGDDRLTGGAGWDIFGFGPGDGVDVVTDFTAGGPEADVIAFNNGAFADLAGVLAASRQEGADLVIAYGAGDVLTLQNVQAGTLSAANFTFA